jgi:hypothetical protein
MTARTFDAKLVNDLANHPDIHPWVSVPDQVQIDLTEQVSDPNNYVLSAPGGVFFFHQVGPAEYEAHSLFIPEARGTAAMQAAREALAFMFGSGARTIYARCPKGNLAVLALTRALKFEFIGIREAAWPTLTRGLVDERWFQMTRERWASLSEYR